MNWQTVKLEEVVFFQEGPGVRNTQFTNSGVKLLNVGNINNGRLDLNTTKIYISEEEAHGKYKHFLVDEGDLLIASSGIIVNNFHNKIAWASKEQLPLCMNTSTIRFKTLDPKRLNLHYFSYFIKSNLFTSQLRRLITGSAQLNFGPSHLKQMSILLPSLDVQKKIVDILDKADQIRCKDQALIKKYDELAQSIFIDMFGDPVINPKGWNINKIKQVADNTRKHSIKAGPFGSSLKKEYYVASGYKIYGQEQVIADDLSIGNYYINAEKYKSLESCKINSGDVLISLVGTYGKITVVPNQFHPGIINPRLMKITLNTKLINQYFFKYLMQFDSQVTMISKFSRGGTMDIVNVGIISDIPIIVPPLEKQLKFLKYLQKINESKKSIESVSNKQLFQSLLQRAFNGELVR